MDGVGFWIQVFQTGGLTICAALLVYVMVRRDPASQKELRDERENRDRLFLEALTKEATARHGMRDTMQEMFSSMELDHEKRAQEQRQDNRAIITELVKQHREDASLDRLAFKEREQERNQATNDWQRLILTELRNQYGELRDAVLAGACKYRPADISQCGIVHSQQKEKNS